MTSKMEDFSQNVVSITTSKDILIIYFRSSSGKANTFLFNEIIKRSGKFPAWQNYNFWIRWFELDVKDQGATLSNLNDVYFNTLLSMSKSMYDLKIDFKFILSCIIDTIAKKKFDSPEVCFVFLN